MSKILTEDIIPTLKQKVEETASGAVSEATEHLNTDVMTDWSQSNISGVSVTFTKKFKNLSTGATLSTSYNLGSANAEYAGLLSATGYTKLQNTASAGELSEETYERQQDTTRLQTQIDAIVASSDVKDVVGTKAALNSYDTKTLGDKDIIKVLQDESENNATTYYRWSAASSSFTLIGSEGPYYTKGETDSLLNGKATTASVTEAKNAADAAQQTANAANTAASNAQSAANNKATITMTSVDPGAGSSLAANNYTAVYGSSAGSVSSGDLSSRAVTSDKVDWSTMYGNSSIPTSKKTFSNGIFTFDVIRVGNICWTSGTTVVSNWPAGNLVDSGQTVSSGFRPMMDATIQVTCTDGQYKDSPRTFTVNANGKVVRSCGSAITGACRVEYSGLWITNDAWV